MDNTKTIPLIPRQDVDFDAWAEGTAKAVREGQWEAVDRETVAEELESMSRSDFHAVRNRLRVLICHLVKWMAAGERESSWRRTIRDQREEILWLFDESPSLKARVLADRRLFEWAWRMARQDAAEELDVDEGTLPAAPVLDLEREILMPGIWPDSLDRYLHRLEHR